jgi:hypothetical protein
MANNVYGKYSFQIISPANQVLADLSAMASNREIKLVRNNTYTAQFTLDLMGFEKYCREINTPPQSILGIGQNILQVSRGDVVIYTGLIERISATVDTKPKITVYSVGWLEVFKYRFTATLVQHTSKTYGQIMWDTIDTSQLLDNGSWGITRGADQTTDLRDKKHENKNIKDALVDITNLSDGPDFEFTPDRIFNVYTKIGAQRDEFEFNYPGNIKALTVDRDAKNMANYVLVRGQGIGDAQFLDIEVDTDSQAQFHLRQYILDKSDVSDTTTLQKAGIEYIQTHKLPIEVVSLTLDGNKSPAFGSYGIGDRVKTVVSELVLFENINDYYQIDEINLSIGENDEEDVKLKVVLYG